MNATKAVTNNDDCVLVPKWLLGRVSHGAIALWCELWRLGHLAGNPVQGAVVTTRDDLASGVRRSKRTVDGWVKELRRVGAIIVERGQYDQTITLCRWAT